MRRLADNMLDLFYRKVLGGHFKSLGEGAMEHTVWRLVDLKLLACSA